MRADGCAGQAASGWQRGACWQAAARRRRGIQLVRGRQGVDPAQQGGGARHAGLARARGPRPPGPAAGRQPPRRAAWVSAAYLAAITGLNRSIGHTARQAVSAAGGAAGRAPGLESPEASRTGTPACLTSDDELS